MKIAVLDYASVIMETKIEAANRIAGYLSILTLDFQS